MSELPKPEAGLAPGSSEARNIVLLRRLVTALAGVMALGMLAIVALMLARLLQEPVLPLPETLTLPEGATASAVTVTEKWYLVVTEAGEVLVYDRDSVQLRQTLRID